MVKYVYSVLVKHSGSLLNTYFQRVNSLPFIIEIKHEVHGSLSCASPSAFLAYQKEESSRN